MNKYGKSMFAMVDANQNVCSPRKHCKALPTSDTPQLHGKKETSEFRNLHCQIQLLITGRNKGKQIFIHNNNVIEKKNEIPTQLHVSFFTQFMNCVLE